MPPLPLSVFPVLSLPSPPFPPLITAKKFFFTLTFLTAQHQLSKSLIYSAHDLVPVVVSESTVLQKQIGEYLVSWGFKTSQYYQTLAKAQKSILELLTAPEYSRRRVVVIVCAKGFALDSSSYNVVSGCPFHLIFLFCLYIFNPFL